MAAVLIGVPAVAGAQISVSPSYDAIGSTGPNPYAFTIENDGLRSTTALLQVSCSGAVTSCSVSTSSVFVGASGGEQTVTVSYTTAGNATGSFTLTATDRLTQQAAQATVNVTMPNAQPSVTANMGTAYTAENVNTSGLQFTITNTGNTAAQYTLGVSCDGNIVRSSCSVSSPTGTLSHNQSTTISVNFTPGAATGGNGTISLTATAPASLGSQASTSPTVTVVPLSEAVQVTPDGDTLALTSNDTVVVPFKVHETGNASTGFNYALTASCSGSIVECTFVSTGIQTMAVPPAPGVDQTVQVRLIGTSDFVGGYGAVSVIASYNNGVNPTYQDEGSYGTTIPDTRSYTPAVTPKGDSAYYEANAPYTVSFSVKNNGNTQATYTLSQPTACTGQATETICVIRAADLNPTVNPGESDTVHVDFTTGPPNQRAHIYLQAQATAGSHPSDAGSWLVVPIAPTVQVTAPTPTTILTNTTASLQFHVKNTGTSGTIAYHLQVTGCTAPLVTTGCTVPDSIIVVQGADSTVTVQVHAQGTTGVGQVMLHASKQFYNTWADSAATSVTVSSRLAVSTAFMNNDNQDLQLCANACFAVTTSRSTVPYYTLDAARSVTLAYNSDRASPRPFVYAEVSFLSTPPSTPTFRLEVFMNGVRQRFVNTNPVLANADSVLSFSGSHLAGQLDLSSDSTGVYPITIVVTALYSGGGSDVATVNTKLIVVNTSKSYVGRGWAIAGVPRLYKQGDGSALITDGTGSALLFASLGSQYTSPVGDYTTLARTYNPATSDSGWVRTALDGTRVWFRGTGLADSVTDRLGFVTRFGYDASSRLSKIHDPMLVRTAPGRDTTVLRYGNYGLSVIQEANPIASSGRITRVTVGPDSLLTAIVDPNGDSTAYVYDGSKRLAGLVDVAGATTSFTYSPTWKLAQITSPSVPIDAGGGTTKPAQPITILHAWQDAGVPISSTYSTPATGLTSGTRSASITDANGNVTSYAVNRWGQPVTITDPEGDVTDLLPDPTDSTRITAASLPPIFNAYAYSGAFLTMDKHGGGDSVFYHYGVDAQVDSTWGAGTVSQRLFLRADGRVDSVRVASSASRVTKYAYDTGTARVQTVTDPAGHTTSYAYDPILGNLSQTTASGARVTSIRFDAYGRDSVVTGPVSKVIRHRDLANRIVFDSIAGNPGHDSVTYFHDHKDVIDGLGQKFQFYWNALGADTAEYRPAAPSLAIKYRYDLGGRLSSVTNRRGQMISMTYDSLDRVRTKSDPISGTVNFQYSRAGLTVIASNSLFTDTTTTNLYCDVSPSFRDDGCTADTTTVVYGGTAYRYGHANPTTFGDTAVAGDPTDVNRTYRFEPTLGLTTKVSLGPLTMYYVYSATDALRTQTTLPGMSTMADSFTTNHEIYWRWYSDSTLNKSFQRAYHYDLDGRIDYYTQSHNGLSTAAEIRKFAYDSAGRLVSKIAGVISCNGFPGSGTNTVDPNQGWQPGCPMPTGNNTFQYDAVGNRTHSLVNGGSDVPGTYVADDRLQSMGTVSYLYDDDGNTTQMSDASTGEHRDYYYDASGLLDSVVVTGGSNSGILRLAYDPYGRLSRRWWYSSFTGTGKIRLYIYDGDNVGKEIDVNNQGATTDYAYDGTDHPIMRVVHNPDGTTASSTTYLYDEVGRVEGAITNGVATGMMNYDDWGQSVGSGPAVSTVRFGFKGMLYDEDVNLYYVRNRWYDPKIGRFTQEDPGGLSGGINLYAFANNDPINGSDPSGLGSTAVANPDWFFGLESLFDPTGLDLSLHFHGGGASGQTSRQAAKSAPTPPKKCSDVRTYLGTVGNQLSTLGTNTTRAGIALVTISAAAGIVAPEALPAEAGGAELGVYFIKVGGAASTLGTALQAYARSGSLAATAKVSGVEAMKEFGRDLYSEHMPGITEAETKAFSALLGQASDALHQEEAACGN